MQLLVGNPTAQSGKNRERIEEARKLLHRRNVQHDFLATLPHGKTPAAVARALQEHHYKGVIAMGGDGTFKEVAAGLLESGIAATLAILPTGTANDQGRSFGLSSSPAELERNVGVIAEGYRAPFDAGHITALDSNGHVLAHDWFFDSSGWGFSPWVLKLRNQDRERVGHFPLLRELWRDQLVYAGAAVRAFAATYVEERKFEADITLADGKTLLFTNISDLIVKNTRFYAGGWIFDPTCSPEDGEMELVAFAGRTEWISRMVVNFDGLPIPQAEMEEAQQMGLLRLSQVHRSSAFRIRILDRAGAPRIDTQLDGEEWVSADIFEISVKKHAIQLIIPRP